jgi:hypothetical protein
MRTTGAPPTDAFAASQAAMRPPPVTAAPRRRARRERIEVVGTGCSAMREILAAGGPAAK